MRVNYADRNAAKEEKWEGNMKLSSVLRRDSTRREARGTAVFYCPQKGASSPPASTAEPSLTRGPCPCCSQSGGACWDPAGSRCLLPLLGGLLHPAARGSLKPARSSRARGPSRASSEAVPGEPAAALI